MTDQDLELRFRRLIDNILKNNPEADTGLVEKAWNMSYRLHEGIKRDSGEPYIVHPLSVAEILCGLKMDEESIAAGFLHDTVEDIEGFSLEMVKEEFGESVAFLVDGVTKLSDEEYEAAEYSEFETDTPAIGSHRRFHPKAVPASYIAQKAENIRKIFYIMNQDMRVMVIKLADRLHNMRTLDAVSRDRQIRTASETIKIFAPIAEKLGLNSLKADLEDMSFRYLYPEEFEELSAKLAKTKAERQDILDEAVKQVRRVLEQRNFKVEIQARAKHLWSIRNKIVKDHFKFEDIYDLLAIRVIVDTEKASDCYTVMGIIHDLWPPIPRLFSDYIANPKANNYQSLHTKVVALDGSPLEVQIRTREMHNTAELGVASHWQYKERLNHDIFEEKISLLRQVIYSWEKNADSTNEFMDNVVNDLFAEQIVAITPRGQVMDLVKGSTPVDFAYKIHSDVGCHCTKAKVNGMEVPLNKELSNGDVVEIITTANSVPSPDWLNFVRTSSAKNGIRQYYKRKYSIENEEKGRDMILRELARQNIAREVILAPELLKRISARYFNYKEMFAAAGCRILSPQWVIDRLKNESVSWQNEERKHKLDGELTVDLEGRKDLFCVRARCCEPLPGEDVECCKTDKGYVIHSVHCANLQRFKKEHPDLVRSVSWPDSPKPLPVKVTITAERRFGLVRDIAAVFADSGTELITIALGQPLETRVDIPITAGISSAADLKALFEKIRQVPDVISIERTVRLKGRDM